jgi:hypothetical protein
MELRYVGRADNLTAVEWKIGRAGAFHRLLVPRQLYLRPLFA